MMNPASPSPRSLLSTLHGPLGAAVTANRLLFAAAFCFSAAMSVLALTTSFYMLQVYDRVLASRSADTLLLLTFISVGAIVVFGWLDSIRTRLLQRIAVRTANALGRIVLRAMVATSSQTGGAAGRNGLRDLDTVRNFLSSAAIGTLFDAPFVIVYLAILAMLHVVLLAIVVMGAAILILLAWANQLVTNALLTRSIEWSAHAHNFADDGLRNSDVLEGMGMSSTFVEQWHAKWIDAMRTGTAAADRDARLASASRVVRLLIQIALLGAGAMLILDLQATGGIMIASSIIGARALAPIESGVATWKNFIGARLSWLRLNDIVLQAPRRDEGMPLPAPLGRLVATRAGFANVTARKIVLTNISFDLNPGESLGIIGPSASGKSTLLRLLIGAWPCSSGSVRLDGADIYAWPRTALSRYVGYLPQDVELFAGSVRENIARMCAGDPEAVVKAAQKAGAHEMILALPKGYDTEVGPRGARLSGGQAQRIGIARALYGAPRLVALDEPNSNLDGAGEEALAATLSALRTDGVTVLIVTHRPNILSGIDKLLALRADGSMETFGPRADVMQQFIRRPTQTNPVVLRSASGESGGRP